MAERVLIADDHERMRSALSNYLGQQGYLIELATNGREAVQQAASGGVDLFILDVEMPDVNGLEACRQIRALPGYDVAPILFVTGIDAPDIYERAVEAGADDFLHKPVNPTELLLRVQSLLRLRALRVEVRRNLEVIVDQHNRLTEALERRQQLAAMIVHDLRSPIATALLSARAMLADAAQGGAPTRATLETIVTACDRVHRMVLDVFDIEHGRGSAHPGLAPIDLWTSLSAAIEEARMRGRVDGVEVVLRSEGSQPLLVLGQSDGLRRVFDNLLDNALRYTGKGAEVGVTVEIAKGSRVVVRVQDLGPGIKGDHKERIFDPYVRLQIPDPRSGRGLGLAYVRRAVESFGGHVWVEDNAPTGAVFCVELVIAS